MSVVPAARRGVRYNPETGWEMRCDDCAASRLTGCYWPISLEFWAPGSLQRCRACERERKRRLERRRYWTDPEYRARKIAEMREGRKARAAYDRVRLDPEKWQRRLDQARMYRARRKAA